MVERYVRPPLIATEPRPPRGRWRTAAGAVLLVLVALVVVLVAGHVGAGSDDPGLPPASHPATATHTPAGG